MFKNAYKFNQEVRTWDVTGIFTTGGGHVGMFRNATEFLATDTMWNTQNEKPPLDFWKTWASYEVDGVIYEPHSNTLALT